MKINNFPSILIYIFLGIMIAIALMVTILALAISLLGAIMYSCYNFIAGKRTVYVNHRNISK